MFLSNIMLMRLEVVRVYTSFDLSICVTKHPLVKLYGELPETAKINETDAMEGGDEECGFEFGGEGDEDDELDIDDI